MNKLARIAAGMIPVLAVVVIACLLLFLEKDFLWKAQELNLFLFTPHFFKEQLVVPGGLLTWLGTFFTQFLYHAWLGVGLLAAWWLLLTWLVKRTFQLKGWWVMVSIIPVLFILVTIVDMGYWIYILKLRGHLFVTTIGTTAVVALLWVFRKVSGSGIANPLQQSANPLQRGVSLTVRAALFVFLTCALGYPLLGIYGLGATLLMSIWIWRLAPRWSRALPVSLVGLLSVVVVPLICYRYVFYQTNLQNIWFAELPLFYIQESYDTYYIPYWLLLLFFVAMVIFAGSKREVNGSGIANPLQQGAKGAKGVKEGKVASLLLHSPFIPLLLILASAVYTYKSWYCDENFQRELVMQRCIENLDWEGVLREAAAQKDEPTRAIVVMRNIALARLGRQSNEMYHYKNGSKRSNAPFDMRMMMSVGVMSYYQYGLMNYCFRLCMEMGVEFGWRAEYLKYLARCSTVNKEWQLAHKYTDLLSHTLYFDDWAKRVGSLTEADVSEDPEMGYLTHMMHYYSELASDQGFVEEFIMKRLSNSSYSGDPIFVEQALLASMWTRNAESFWYHLSCYAKLHPGKQLPKHIQEAAIHYGTIEERKDIETWPFDESVKKQFKRFVEITPRYNKMEVGVIRKALEPEFGHTYYYDYYLMDKLPQY